MTAITPSAAQLEYCICSTDWGTSGYVVWSAIRKSPVYFMSCWKTLRSCCPSAGSAVSPRNCGTANAGSSELDCFSISICNWVCASTPPYHPKSSTTTTLLERRNSFCIVLLRLSSPINYDLESSAGPRECGQYSPQAKLAKAVPVG